MKLATRPLEVPEDGMAAEFAGTLDAWKRACTINASSSF